MLLVGIQKLLIPSLVLLWALLYLVGILDQNPQDQMLIRPVFFLLVLLFVINSYTDIKSMLKQDKAKEGQTQVEFQKTFIFMVLVVSYFILVETLGFLITTILFMFSSLYLLNARTRLPFIGLSLILPVILYFIFTSWFNVPLPTGILF